MKQICNLELAIKLEELGFKQESLWYHYQQVGGIVCDTEVRGKWIIRPCSERGNGFGKFVSAFTVAELSEMLPWEAGKDYYYAIKDYYKRWVCLRMNIGTEKEEYIRRSYADTQADALAKLLIYLKEKEL